MKPAPFIAVDCGASRVAFAQLSVERSGRRVARQCLSEALDEGWTTETEWLEQTSDALRRLTSRTGWHGDASLILPGHVTLTKHLTTPAIGAANRARILRFEASQNIPHPLEDVVWDSIVIAEEEQELSVLLTAAKRRVASELCAAAERSGLRVMRVLPAWFTLARGYQLNSPAQDGSVLLIDVGARSTQLVWCDGHRLGVRTLALGGRGVTLAIAEELRIDVAEAEALKRTVHAGASDLPVDSPVRAAVRRAGEMFGERLQREIVRSVLSWPHRAALAPPATVRLFGGGAGVATLATQLSEGLRLPVVRDAALSETEPPGASLVPNVCWLGAAAAGAQPMINLLPEALRAARTRRVRESYWLATAVLLALALLPAIRLEEYRAAADGAHATEIELRLRPRREFARRNADALAQLADLAQREAGRRKQLEARSQWRRFLADLQERLATEGDVWLETLAVVRPGERSGEAMAGERAGKSNLRFKISGKLLDARGGPAAAETEVQPRLRRLLARLEQSPFVAGVEGERFERGGKGLVRFEASLVAATEQPW